MSYGNAFGGQPSNNLWIGNNYSQGAGYNRNNYPNGQNSMQNQVGQPQPQPQSMNNVLQVMGPESALAYQVGPDSHLILMDSHKPVFYIKRSDSSGYCETKAYEFHEIPLTQEKNQMQMINPDYVTKTEFEDFKKMIEELVMKNE